MARDLEDPFTAELGGILGANRLHAPRMQTHFDARLVAVAGLDAIDGRVPDEWRGGIDRYGPFLQHALGASFGSDALPADGGDRAASATRLKEVLVEPVVPSSC